jgi:hypothetical protein
MLNPTKYFGCRLGFGLEQLSEMGTSYRRVGMDLRSASRGTSLVGRVGMDLRSVRFQGLATRPWRRGRRPAAGDGAAGGGLVMMVSPTQIRTDGESRESRGWSTGVAAQPDLCDLLVTHPSTVMRGEGAPGSSPGGDTRGSGATRPYPSGECERVPAVRPPPHARQLGQQQPRRA